MATGTHVIGREDQARIGFPATEHIGIKRRVNVPHIVAVYVVGYAVLTQAARMGGMICMLQKSLANRE